MIGVLFPVAHEAAAFIAQLDDRVSFRLKSLACVVGALDGKPVAVGVLGMGREWAEHHLPLFLDHFKLDRLILAGYAGGLLDDLTRGDVVILENFCHGALPLKDQGIRRARGISSESVVSSCAGKRALAEVHGAAVVDMESETVFKMAQGRQIPLWVIRVISDTVHDELPSGALSASFDSKKNRPSPARLVVYLAAHLKEIKPFARFVIGLGSARKNLTDSLVSVLKAAF